MHSELAIVLAFGVASCSPSLPEPPVGPHPDAEFEDVPYPPPAAAPEIVPPPPDEHAVWIDGQWTWRGRFYVWDRGGWVIPPQDAYYASPERRFGMDGTLWLAPGGWFRRSDGMRLPPPAGS